MLRSSIVFQLRKSVFRRAQMSSLSNITSVVDNCDMFLFDCDGVIWKGNSAIEGAARTIEYLRKRGKIVKFVTNNSMKSRLGFIGKFASMNITVDFDDIYCSSFAAAAYLVKNPMQPHQKVFIIGHAGIEEEMQQHGISFVSGRQFNDTVVNFGSGAKVDFDSDVGAVVVGLDLDLNYYKIQYAQLCLNQNKGCRFIATNMDKVAHVTDAQEWAAGGAAVGAVKGCTGKEPVLVGKPSSFLVDHILEKHPCVARDRVCMVGDNLNTDILFGLSSGLQTVLTLSGVTSEQQLLSQDNHIRPHYYCNSIADLMC